MLSKWDFAGGGDDGRTMLVILYIGICVGAALAYVAAKEKELHRRERALLDRELALRGLVEPPPGVVVLPPAAAGAGRELEGLGELVRGELRRIIAAEAAPGAAGKIS